MMIWRSVRESVCYFSEKHNVAIERRDGRIVSPEPHVRSKNPLKFLFRQLAVPQYLGKKSASDSLTPVNRHYRTPAIGMAKKMVATLPADHLKPKLPEGADEALASD